MLLVCMLRVTMLDYVLSVFVNILGREIDSSSLTNWLRFGEVLLGLMMFLGDISRFWGVFTGVRCIVREI